ncbi:MAG: SUF system NifU family Fe-S cluster assembly protein [Erysipelotrichaceae bacterium]|jgi:nitrogen fixation NifU-like protein|nr:SUF system NifU family Fe-S cluster assembly protein [Erysipelotrichaceae bacterium]MDO5439194.1 SUF system NifU family Fe-S cluster assembly protein [Erysipelotrichaceae bacterium]
MMDTELKRAILIDHYQKPHNHGLVEDARYAMKHQASSSCIDDIKVQLDIEGDIVKDVRFDGVGCTISTASTSIFSDLIKGKTREEALEMIERYYKLLRGEEDDYEELEEAQAFDTLYAQPNRIKCGLIGVEAMEELIKESYKK